MADAVFPAGDFPAFDQCLHVFVYEEQDFPVFGLDP
jgi:hypothetical protein